MNSRPEVADPNGECGGCMQHREFATVMVQIVGSIVNAPECHMVVANISEEPSADNGRWKLW